MSDITITCNNKHCQQTSNNPNTHYISTLFTTTHNAPQHCPVCAAHQTLTSPVTIKVRPQDYADTLCTSYKGVHRKLALKAIEICAQHNAHRTTSITPEQVITTAFHAQTTHRNSVNVYCYDCDSQYSLITTPATTPHYCIFCSSKNIGVSPSSFTPINSLDMIAAVINIPVSLVTALYTQWTQQAYYKTFQSFIDRPDTQQLITAFKARTSISA